MVQTLCSVTPGRKIAESEDDLKACQDDKEEW